MTEMVDWTEVKDQRGDADARRRGYREANDAFDLGATVRVERERRGLIQAELAERMGIAQPTIARLEAGGVNPSLDTLHRAALALGLELVVDFREPASA
jgi:ribosome-binding protein aMBF1 (putative translation factor)